MRCYDCPEYEGYDCPEYEGTQATTLRKTCCLSTEAVIEVVQLARQPNRHARRAAGKLR